MLAQEQLQCHGLLRRHSTMADSQDRLHARGERLLHSELNARYPDLGLGLPAGTPYHPRCLPKAVERAHATQKERHDP